MKDELTHYRATVAVVYVRRLLWIALVVGLLAVGFFAGLTCAHSS